MTHLRRISPVYAIIGWSLIFMNLTACARQQYDPRKNLKIICSEIECSVRFKDKVLTTEYAGSNIPELQYLGASQTESKLFLLEISEGDGCPALYKIIEIEADASAYVTDAFGNCDSPEKIERDGDVLKFYFDACSECNRDARIYCYQNKTLQPFCTPQN